MRKQFSKFAQVAGIMLALALTFGCSSDDSGSGNSSGGGDPSSPNGSGSENSKIYYKGSDSLITGNGTITVYRTLPAGEVTNGKVNLQLPTNVPDVLLEDIMLRLKDIFNMTKHDDCEIYHQDCRDINDFCTISPNDTKGLFEPELRLTIAGDQDGLMLQSKTGDNEILNWYFSKAGKITCDYRFEKIGNGITIIKINIDAEPGWNKIYGVRLSNPNTGVESREYSTNDILTEKVRWTFDPSPF